MDTPAEVPSKPPSPPRLRSSDLPEDDIYDSEPRPFLSGHPILPEDMDLSDLTPSQLQQMNQDLLDDSVPRRPLIDELVSMSVLRAEYENGSASFVKQIDYLRGSGFKSIRRTRGDGDCFYRSVAYSYVNQLLRASDVQFAVATALSNLESSQSMLELAGFQKIVYEDFYDCLGALIQNIVSPDHLGRLLSEESLLEAFQDPEVSNSVVVYLRLLTSAQIRADPEGYAPFLFHPELGEQMETREFCEQFVEAVGKEADHVQITALSRALKINVNIAYLDGHSADGNVDFVEFHFADPDTDSLILLYRPGHYDVLERRNTVAER